MRIVSVVLFALAVVSICSKAETNQPVAPRLQNLGALHVPVTTTVTEAQRFFDQGLTLLYAFNHHEADRAFREAQRLDPKCAMCFWGEALAVGPNINDSLPDDEREMKAYQAIQTAKKIGGGDQKERALIGALSRRHPSSKPADGEGRNKAYAEAMADVYQRFPDDPDVGVLYAASLMNTTPWDYWADGDTLKPEVAALTRALTKVIRDHPEHPGAHHYYIHAVEASDDPELAVPSADRLGSLVPVAGHLVHMPSHIYIRVGRYRDASIANIKASKADEDYITQCRAQGMYPSAYYPHNVHFLWAALTMEGRSAEAIEAAHKTSTRHDDHHFEDPTFAFPHLLGTVPLFAYTRFGKWQEVLSEPKPRADRPFRVAIWHFARGMAFRSNGDIEKAEAELAELSRFRDDPKLAELMIFGNNSLQDMTLIAVSILGGEVAAMKGDVAGATELLRQAAQVEDGLIYSEPRDWPQPARHSLGAVLLEHGKPAEAEQVYLEDLQIHRENGWALYGLWRSLLDQGKESEAAAARRRFEAAWGGADFTLDSSRL